ncbi:hypothetical protein ACTUVJ_002220 [Stenotrophomonas indicatrix]
MNKRLDMPVWGFVAALIGSFLMGALAVWIAFGFAWTPDTKGLRGWLYGLISSPGNVAAWLAAAGTWVIGYGAWKYAKEAHELRTREVAVQQQTRLEAELYSLDQLKIRVDASINCASLIEEIHVHEHGVERAEVLAACETIALVVKTLDLAAPATTAIDAEGSDGLNALRLAISNIFDVGGLVVQQLSEDRREFVQKAGRVEELWSDAGSILEYAQAAMDGIDRRSHLLRGQMNS